MNNVRGQKLGYESLPVHVEDEAAAGDAGQQFDQAEDAAITDQPIDVDELTSQISGLVESALGVAVAVDAQLMQV